MAHASSYQQLRGLHEGEENIAPRIYGTLAQLLPNSLKEIMKGEDDKSLK
jgi:hypothetical protein